MSSHSSAIQDAQAVIDHVSVGMKRTNWTMLGVLLKTFGLPLIVLVLTRFAGDYVRAFVEVNFGDSLLNFSVAVATFLLTVVLTVQVWRRTEARFHGGAMLKRVGAILRRGSRLQNLIDNAQPDDASTPDGLDEAAEAFWQAYIEYLEALGLTETHADVSNQES